MANDFKSSESPISPTSTSEKALSMLNNKAVGRLRNQIILSAKSMLRLWLGWYYHIRLSEIVCSLLTARYERKFQKSRKLPSGTRQAIVNELVEKGYAIRALSDFLIATELDEIQLTSNRIRRGLRDHRCTSNTVDKSGKNFLVRQSSVRAVEMTDPLVRFVAAGFALDIAREYFSQEVRLTNIDYWLNFPTKENSGPVGSQAWHRDYEDRKVLKVFIYLEKVSASNGPFHYVEDTHSHGQWYQNFPTKPPLGVVVNDSDITRSFPEEKIKAFYVDSGTVLFADTAGLHKGGFCEIDERFIFTATYTSFAGISQPLPALIEKGTAESSPVRKLLNKDL